MSLAHFRRLYPASIAALRILDWTAATPSLPFITASATGDRELQTLRSSLAAVAAERELDEVRDQLFLEGFDLDPAGDFTEVLHLERGAARMGYPKLI